MMCLSPTALTVIKSADWKRTKAITLLPQAHGAKLQLVKDLVGTYDRYTTIMAEYRFSC